MLISIDGITGSGKSTCQRILSQHYGAETLTMQFEKHPYLATSELERREFALERELIFLLMGYHQLRHTDVANRVIVSDFIFESLRVFATGSLYNGPKNLDTRASQNKI